MPACHSALIGCVAIAAAAPVCTLLVGQTSRCRPSALASSTRWRRAGSASASARRTPWPMRRAPRRPASSTRSAASASPACSVSGRPASRAIASAWAWSPGGKPCFGPGQVESRPRRGRTSAAPVPPRAPSRPAAAGASRRRSGRWAARCGAGRPAAPRTTSSPARPWASNSSGAMRNSASTAAVGARVFGGLEGHALQRGGRGHRGHGQRKAFEVLHQAAGVGVGVEPGRQRRHVVRRGRRCRAACSRSNSVATRRPPSRCSCSSTLGRAAAVASSAEVMAGS